MIYASTRVNRPTAAIGVVNTPNECAVWNWSRVSSGAPSADSADEEALVDALARLSWLAGDNPVEEIEVNPLVAGPDGVVALNLHVTIEG